MGQSSWSKETTARFHTWVLVLGSQRFGPPSREVVQYVTSIWDDPGLDDLTARVCKIKSWDELLAGKEPTPVIVPSSPSPENE